MSEASPVIPKGGYLWILTHGRNMKALTQFLTLAKQLALVAKQEAECLIYMKTTGVHTFGTKWLRRWFLWVLYEAKSRREFAGAGRL